MVQSSNQGEIIKILQNILTTNSSKVVDANGEPLVVYHSTNTEFSAFDIERLGENSGDLGTRGVGFYFSPSFKRSSLYGYIDMSLFLNIRNPYTIDFGKSFVKNLSHFNLPEIRELKIKDLDKTIGEFIDAYTDITGKINKGIIEVGEDMRYIFGKQAKNQVEKTIFYPFFKKKVRPDFLPKIWTDKETKCHL